MGGAYPNGAGVPIFMEAFMDHVPLTSTDIRFVISHLPKPVRELAKKHRLILAGGLIRARIAGERCSDIDLFGHSVEQLEAAAAEFAGEGSRVLKTKNAITVVRHGKTTVQFITRWLYEEPAVLIQSFDFTIAQAAVYFEDGQWKGLCAPGFYSDLAARRLVYTRPERNEDAGGSLLRMRKFLARGYNIQVASIAAVVTRLIRDLKVNGKPLPIHFLDGESTIERILCGLLYEVDPLRVIDGVPVDEHAPIEGLDDEAMLAAVDGDA